MANRRMIHKNISYSKQVNQLSEFQQLLFTWTIPHLDDFGKIQGDGQTLKAIVMPLSERPISDFEEAILQMINVHLIERYEVNEEMIIRFLGFETYQQGLKKRTKSKFPENPNISVNFSEISRDSKSTEPNRTKPNLTTNRTETSKNSQENSYKQFNPESFIPINDTEYAALEAWRVLEPDNPKSFTTTYYYACKRGLPAYLFLQFVSEIKQSKNIKNKGAIFNSKVTDYFNNKQRS